MGSTSELARQKRFGRIIRQRRDELGLTQLQIGDLGGPSAPTIRKIEDGEAAISTSTLNKLDGPLRWHPGSAARTYAGGEPSSSAALTAGAPRASVVSGPDAIPFDIVDLTGLLAAAGRLDGLLRTRGDADPELSAAVGEVNGVVSRLSARYATTMLERNGGPGRALHPLVEMAFAHLLAVPAEAGDPVDLDERRYRRWLAGRDDQVDQATTARFRARWQAAIADPALPKAASQ
ncbi:helix-turn-helix domain-containing protein [Nocardia thailandica]|uniref:helix-turn-helix domain-containing protein n=1 Tax=Nocardia thailandica TaxID=257275 RepID=UPI0014613450|nr:helix-turn-helix domain-containing protein [Nocardia thailandica]